MYKLLCLTFLSTFAFSMGAAYGPPPQEYDQCLQFYRYERDPATGKYYGLITINYDGSGMLELQVNVSMLGFYGKENVNINLEMLTPLVDILMKDVRRVQYKLSVPVQESMPKITGITVNNVILCQAAPFKVPNAIILQMSVTHTTPLGAAPAGAAPPGAGSPPYQGAGSPPYQPYYGAK